MENLTKRELFAALAMQGLLSTESMSQFVMTEKVGNPMEEGRRKATLERLYKKSIELADGLIAEIEKK